MTNFRSILILAIFTICQLDTAMAAQADLAASNFSFSPQTISVGAHPDAVSFRLSNNGPENLASPNTRVMAYFYISKNTTFGDGDDISIGNNGYDFTLSSGSYTDVTLSATGRSYITIPSGASGDYYVFIRVQHASPSTLTDPNSSNDYAMRSGQITVPGSTTPISYVVCISQSTYDDVSWQNVVDNLVSKYGASVIKYTGTAFPENIRTTFASIMPRYLCFVAKISELSEQYVRTAHQLVRSLDNDPYGDCLWGIITGYTADDALRMVQAGPLSVHSGLLKTAGDWLNYLNEGIYHSETNNAVMWTKPPGGLIDKSQSGPTDDTKPLVDELNTNSVDIMITSGHANYNVWQLHYPDNDGEGFFRCDNGQLYGIDASSNRYNINSTNPKIYYAPGNCLIALAADNNSMVAGWLHTGGAVQYGGYTVETMYGYMGWGVSDYFLQLQDRFTFAEAVFLTNQALLFDEEKSTPGIDPNALAHDKDVFVLYGDPAYDARIYRSTDPTYEQTLSYSKTGNPDEYQFTLSVHLNKTVNVSKPVISFLPFHVKNISLVSCNARDREVADNLAMMQLWAQGDQDLVAGQEWQLVFKATSVVTDVRQTKTPVPTQYSVSQNYPNPFNPTTTIEFSLQHPSHVSLKIYSILGEEVANLVDDNLQSGTYKAQWDAKGLASGVYLYRLRTKDFIETKKLVLLR